MAPPVTNPKIEELRFRLKADPKSRLFYPLAEELRKVGQFPEAEQVLRGGLANHPTYLSAWVSLGRVLRDRKEERAAVEPLSKALQLDPGNVVAARLLADAYLALDEKVEAIKKYKLVHALMPVDEEVAARIAQLERDLNPQAAVPVELSASPEAAVAAPAETSPFEDEPAPTVGPSGDDTQRDHQAASWATAVDSPARATLEPSEPSPFPDEPSSPFASEPPRSEPQLVWTAEPSADPRSTWSAEPVPDTGTMREEAQPEPAFPESSPWSSDTDGATDEALPLLEAKAELADETADAEPMRAEHEESPFEEPDDDYTAAAFAVEVPEGMHMARAPLAAEVPLVWSEAEELPLVDEVPGRPEPFADESPETAIDEAEVFAPPGEPSVAEAPFDLETPAQEEPEDTTATLTMADLYTRQGLTADAQRVYETILHRDPDNHEVQARLNELLGSPAGSDPRSHKIAVLQGWLAKMAKREVGGV
jgi:cytochrome c-type biogenesis protein CcmH/NrfG